MPAARLFRRFNISIISACLLLLALFASFFSTRSIRGDEKKSADPWPASHTVLPSDLVRELAEKNEAPPVVVYVGFHTLFKGGHIPGASFHGSASTEQGLAELKKWAESLPRSANLVIYCGCCPFERCPNIRPAFTTLNNMGFNKLRVLVLPTNFATDWVDKSYPIQKGM